MNASEVSFGQCPSSFGATWNSLSEDYPMANRAKTINQKTMHEPNASSACPTKGLEIEKKTHAFSPSTSGKTDEKPVQSRPGARQESRFAI